MIFGLRMYLVHFVEYAEHSFYFRSFKVLNHALIRFTPSGCVDHMQTKVHFFQYSDCLLIHVSIHLVIRSFMKLMHTRGINENHLRVVYGVNAQISVGGLSVACAR